LQLAGGQLVVLLVLVDEDGAALYVNRMTYGGRR
jgi:hypothetical protein